MTREEAIERFEKVSDSAINSPDSCDVISLYESIKIIKEIYDSFENRSCNDCNILHQALTLINMIVAKKE